MLMPLLSRHLNPNLNLHLVLLPEPYILTCCLFLTRSRQKQPHLMFTLCYSGRKPQTSNRVGLLGVWKLRMQNTHIHTAWFCQPISHHINSNSLCLSPCRELTSNSFNLVSGSQFYSSSGNEADMRRRGGAAWHFTSTQWQPFHSILYGTLSWSTML